MPTIYLTIKHYVDTMGTPLEVGQAMIYSNQIRFRSGYIQVLGGNQQLTATLMPGVTSAMLPWNATNGTPYVGIGSSTHLEVLNGTGLATLTDISPTALASASPVGLWSLDHFGENLIGCWLGSTLYQWAPPVSGGNIATPVTGAPTVMNSIFTAAPEQQVFALGIYSASLGSQDPLLIGFCDIANINDWTATPTNQAGTFRLPTGSRLVGGIWFGIQGLIWTDVDLWAAAYVNFPLVYGFNQISRNCGLIAEKAFAVLGNIIVWMAYNTFFIYDGASVQELPCTVLDSVFSNVNTMGTSLDGAFVQNVHADANTGYGEVTWWYPTVGSGGACNCYVKWTKATGGWDVGGPSAFQLQAWANQSGADAFPTATDSGGRVLQIDGVIGFLSGTNSSLLTGWFGLGEGEDFVFLERLLPDIQLIGTNPQVEFTVTVGDYPAQTTTDRTYGPYTVVPGTQFIPVRARGRYAQFILNCTSNTTAWRLGKIAAVVQPDGRGGVSG